MALENVNEKVENEVAESGENLPRAASVFPTYATILIVCLVAVYACQAFVDGMNTILVGNEKSSYIAGFDKPAFIAGQYWRILTGTIMHGGLISFVFSCYGIYALGRLIETLSNRAHLAIIFLLAAFGGNLLSWIVLPAGVSVGAAGGVFGLLGYLAIYAFKRRQSLSPDFSKSLIFNAVFVGLIGIIIPLVSENKLLLDNFGNLGGLLIGLIYGFLQISEDSNHDPHRISGATEGLGTASLGIIAAVSIFAGLTLFGIV